MPRNLQVIADDLSGAAECAAALAQASCRPAPLVLHGALPLEGDWVVDSDTRALPPAAAADRVASLVREATHGRGSGDLLFKKIDSTLRGHLGAELRGALAACPELRAAVVCPALPAQGRTVRDGVLYVHGQPLLDAAGEPLALTRLLAGAADAEPVLLQPRACHTAPALARELLCAIERGTRVFAVDAQDAEDLRRIALAVVIASRSARLLAVGAAGLAKALATELLQAGAPEHPMLPTGIGHAPIVGIAGSFSAVARQQVDELAAQPGVHLARLDASEWGDPSKAAEAVRDAQERTARGEAVILCVSAIPAAAAATRNLVERIAEAAEPLLRGAGTLVLTGGATARAVLDRLGVDRLEVVGELEPGICVSRNGTQAIVTKAGAFGDAQSLARVLRHLRTRTPMAVERKE